MSTVKTLRLLIAAIVLTASTPVFATTGDTAIAHLNVSGTVPAVFSVQARGIPGDLDLTPGAIVIDRVIGLLHFKYNQDAASIKIESSTADGGPAATSGQAYVFGAAFKVGAIGTCVSLAAPFKASGGVALTNGGGVDYGSATSKDLTTTGPPISGIEEDCQIAASWTGTTSTLPLAGVYAMTVTVTMVAD